jgi:hypothetical protein
MPKRRSTGSPCGQKCHSRNLGSSRCHCTGSSWVNWSLSTELLPGGDALPFERTPDGGWVMSQHLGDACRAQALEVQGLGPVHVDGPVVVPVVLSVLVGSDNLEVVRAVIGGVVVDVVNVRAFRSLSNEAVFVGLDYLMVGGPDQLDVPVGSEVPGRLNTRWFLTTPQGSPGLPVGLPPNTLARVTAPSLSGSARHVVPTVNTSNHYLIVQWSCHGFFNSDSAFDKHRIGDFGVDRRCMTEQEMLQAGMVLNKDGFWTTGVFAREIVRD